MNIFTLKCDIVGKEDNYKYLVTLYAHHFREQFTFSVFFFLASLFLGSLRHEAQCFVHTLGYLVEYDNVEVKEKSVLCHAS